MARREATADRGVRPDAAGGVSRRTRRRFARRQWSRRWMSLRYVLALLLVVAAVGTAVWLVFFSTVLAVKGVTVAGTDLLAEDDVRSAARVPGGEPLALVDVAGVRARVQALAPVRSVDVSREWPDQVRIEVEERTAVAVVELGGRLRGMDADGVVFRDYRTPPPGLPRVRPTTSAGTEALREAGAVVAALPQDIAQRVDHVEVETVDQIALVLKDGRRVLWGSAEESSVKAEVIAALLEQQAQVYDVSVPGSPVTSG
jgi:cell division protein FtsQ